MSRVTKRLIFDNSIQIGIFPIYPKFVKIIENGDVNIKEVLGFSPKFSSDIDGRIHVI